MLFHSSLTRVEQRTGVEEEHRSTSFAAANQRALQRGQQTHAAVQHLQLGGAGLSMARGDLLCALEQRSDERDEALFGVWRRRWRGGSCNRITARTTRDRVPLAALCHTERRVRVLLRRVEAGVAHVVVVAHAALVARADERRRSTHVARDAVVRGGGSRQLTVDEVAGTPPQTRVLQEHRQQ